MIIALKSITLSAIIGNYRKPNRYISNAKITLNLDCIFSGDTVQEQ